MPVQRKARLMTASSRDWVRTQDAAVHLRMARTFASLRAPQDPSDCLEQCGGALELIARFNACDGEAGNAVDNRCNFVGSLGDLVPERLRLGVHFGASRKNATHAINFLSDALSGRADAKRGAGSRVLVDGASCLDPGDSRKR